MKSTGIIRKVDDLGRIVLPVELRRSLGIEERDPLEIFVEEDQIILRKSSVVCVFCGTEDNVSDFKGKGICDSCRASLHS
jgi:transcriptional pleiotropic regulator of transition state genes